MATEVIEIKSAKALARALDTYSFKAPVFAYFLTRNHIKVQRRVFQILIECIWIWATWYDNNDWDDDEGMNLYAEAKRMQDILKRLGYTAGV